MAFWNRCQPFSHIGSNIRQSFPGSAVGGFDESTLLLFIEGDIKLFFGIISGFHEVFPTNASLTFSS